MVRAIGLTVSLVAVSVVLGCASAPQWAGTYRIEQDGQVIGEGAEAITLTLKEDKTYAVEAGPMTLLSGTWTAEKTSLSLSNGNATIMSQYTLTDGKLVPIADGQPVKSWRWTKK